MRRALVLLTLLATAAPAAAAPPRPRIDLPAAATASTPGTWLVGARPTRTADALARRHGAEVLEAGSYAVPRGRARELAAALRARGLLLNAERDRLSRTSQAPRAVADDPLDAQSRWRDVIVEPALAPPAVTPESPLLAVIDSKIDEGHPEFAGSNVVADSGELLVDAHGTSTTAVAAAPKNDRGIVGVWPGMRALNVPLPSEIPCSASVRGIRRAVEAGAAVINMSYASAGACYAEYRALQRAFASGITLVAAAGNEFNDGNPLEYPASLPHVVTVAALTPDDKSAFFSNENAAIDLGAPGVGILTAVPVRFDTDDGTPDGYAGVSGTSFAAPMVAAAATWIRAARPDLVGDQVAQVVRLSARDIGRKGWDAATGYGMLNVARALTYRAPAVDPAEPNENVEWVDGRALGERAPYVFTGARRSFGARLDAFEDPIDVYRVRVPARSRLIVTARPRFGNPDLAIFRRGARSIRDRRRLVDLSQRKGTRTDTVRFANPSGRATTAYVALLVDSRGRSLDSSYTLTIRRG
jgi:subtilisin family serine protease